MDLANILISNKYLNLQPATVSRLVPLILKIKKKYDKHKGPPATVPRIFYSTIEAIINEEKRSTESFNSLEKLIEKIQILKNDPSYEEIFLMKGEVLASSFESFKKSFHEVRRDRIDFNYSPTEEEKTKFSSKKGAANELLKYIQNELFDIYDEHIFKVTTQKNTPLKGYFAFLVMSNLKIKKYSFDLDQLKNGFESGYWSTITRNAWRHSRRSR